MSNPPECLSRRALLAGLTGAVSGAAGCSDFFPGEGASATPPAATTPPPGGCEPVRVPYPSPTGEFSPREYPGFPGQLGSAEVEDYATLFELALQYNRLVARAGDAYESLDIRGSVPEESIEGTEDGYIVGVTTTLTLADSETETPPSTVTAAPSGETQNGAWYYVTNRFAIRSDATYIAVKDGVASNASFDGADTVACDGTIRTVRK